MRRRMLLVATALFAAGTPLLAQLPGERLSVGDAMELARQSGQPLLAICYREG